MTTPLHLRGEKSKTKHLPLRNVTDQSSLKNWIRSLDLYTLLHAAHINAMPFKYSCTFYVVGHSLSNAWFTSLLLREVVVFVEPCLEGETKNYNSSDFSTLRQITGKQRKREGRRNWVPSSQIIIVDHLLLSANAIVSCSFNSHPPNQKQKRIIFNEERGEDEMKKESTPGNLLLCRCSYRISYRVSLALLFLIPSPCRWCVLIQFRFSCFSFLFLQLPSPWLIYLLLFVSLRSWRRKM